MPDFRGGNVVFGFPALLLLAGNVKDSLTGFGFTKPGEVQSSDIALAGSKLHRADGVRHHQAGVTRP